MNTTRTNYIWRLVRICGIMLVLVLLVPITTFSQFQGYPVSIAVNNQVNPVMTTDVNG